MIWRILSAIEFIATSLIESGSRNFTALHREHVYNFCFDFHPISIFIENVFVNSYWRSGTVCWMGWRVESNANLDLDNHQRLLPSFFLSCDSNLSSFVSTKGNKKFISIWKDKIFLCIKKIRTKIYLLMVWKGARKDIMQT